MTTGRAGLLTVRLTTSTVLGSLFPDLSKAIRLLSRRSLIYLNNNPIGVLSRPDMSNPKPLELLVLLPGATGIHNNWIKPQNPNYGISFSNQLFNGVGFLRYRSGSLLNWYSLVCDIGTHQISIISEAEAVQLSDGVSRWSDHTGQTILPRWYRSW